MYAMVMNRVGGPEVLEWQELPTPEPGPDEVLIRIAYAGVNPADWKDREGHLARYYPYQFPYVIGMDGAGVVEKVGPGVVDYQPGDRVVTCSYHGKGRWGSYAEYVATPLRTVAQLPAAIGFAEAATIPIAGMTAWQAVHDKGQIRAGQRVLVHGGSGAVGSFALQFAKQTGALVAVTSSGKKANYVRGLGADLVIDYKTQNIAEALLSWAPGGVDVIIDAVSCGTLPAAFDLLRTGGTLVSIPTLVGDGDVEADFKAAAERGLTKVFSVMNDEVAYRDMADIIELVVAGAVRVPPLEVLPIQQAGRAHTLVEQGQVTGKIVLKVADIPA